MAKQEAPLLQLRSYLPEGSFDEVMRYLQQYKVHLTITRKRETILGDYRHAHGSETHRISVNGNLNKYSFLITLLHELAHLFTYERFGHRVQPHGAEWKDAFGRILAQFLLKNIFPDDIRKALLRTLQNPAASSCGDEKLLRVLQQYDPAKAGVTLVESVPLNALFRIKGNRIFRRGEKIRKRYNCVEVATGKRYLFSGMYEVELVESDAR